MILLLLHYFHCLTGPLDYKYSMIFVLVLGVICTLRGAVGELVYITFCFQEKRDQVVNDVLKTTDLTENEIQDIRANIPPVELRDVAKPADSEDEEAKQDFLLKHKIQFEKEQRIARCNQT